MLTVRNPYRSLIRVMLFVASGFILFAAGASTIAGELVSVLAAVVGAGMLLTATILAVVGRFHIKKIQKLMNGENLLAVWEYDDNRLEESARAEYNKEISKGKKMLIGFPIVGALVVYLQGETNEIVYGILGGAIAGLIAFSFVYVYAKEYLTQSMQPPFKVFISPTSVYMGGRYIDWSSYGFSFGAAAITETKDRGKPFLQITYNVKGRYGTEEKNLLIPIPPGKKEEAEKIIGLLR